jgi:D-alanyl-D-alanine carboxypeptidase/D-alanyl-D-alanine-endopeptidase (penicillin-binding protein 4)
MLSLRSRLTPLPILLAGLLALGACAPKTPPTVTPPPPAAAAAAARPVSAKALPAELDRIFAAPAFDRMQWAVMVQSLASGEVLYQRNPAKLMMPASNMKVLTLAATAERLGWEFTWNTRLLAAGAMEQGILNGDLVVVGSGDPTINSRGGSALQVFERWADLLAASGIRRIEGRVLADARAFDREGLGAGWAWDYLEASYAAPVGALQFNEDVAEAVVRPGPAAGGPAVVEVRPAESGLVVDNRVVTVAGGSTDVRLRRLPGSERLTVTGQIAVGAKEVVRLTSVDSPTDYFARALRSTLVGRGIEVTGLALDFERVDVPPILEGARELFVHRSPPLSEAARVLMKVSQNLYAETFLKTLGAQSGDGSSDGGQKAVEEVLQSWGVPPDAYVLADGSGLSRYNYVTAETMVTVLRRMYRDERHREAFLATLPVGGQDGGTIARRFRGTRAENNVRAKTGSIANVRALSGYVTTTDGEPLVFSIIANHFTQPQATIDAATDLAVERLANVKR